MTTDELALDGGPDLALSSAHMFEELLRRTHLSAASDLATEVAEVAVAIGAIDLVIYLVDYTETHLVPVPGGSAASRTEATVEGSTPGRAYSSATILRSAAGAGRCRLWVPLVDGTDRLGVLEMTVAGTDGAVDPALVTAVERYAHLVAQLVIGKGAYGDIFEQARRRRPMSVSAELLWGLLPPRTCATNRIVIAGMLEPCYGAGGDVFDYAVNDDVAHLAIFDSMGHGLAATGLASMALATYRNARRERLSLPATYAAVDAALMELFAGERYATALMGELDLVTGRLSWVSAGHPPPLLVRDGTVVKTLEARPSTPLGVPYSSGPVEVATESLEPGDRVLFYTDGLPEARHTDGSFFTLDRLAEFIERQAMAGRPAPETLRRLRQAIMTHQDGVLQDDATALLFEWRGGTHRALVPQTVMT